MGSTEGALKVAAKKAGVAVDEYQQRRAAGLKWCTNCRAWQPVGEFGSDRSRWDGLVASCRESKNRKAKVAYQPRPGPTPGRSFVPARDGDKKQARRRVNYFVEFGLLPHPSKLPCADCGQVWRSGLSRHEYDHYRGYAREHHEDVQAVCGRCHHKRESSRATGTE